MSRAELWAAYDQKVEEVRAAHHGSPPYFIARVGAHTWHIQRLVKTPPPRHGKLKRLLTDPPAPPTDLAYYTSLDWDSHFETREEAAHHLKVRLGLADWRDPDAPRREPYTYQRFDYGRDAEPLKGDA